ncbi:hypothetical protein NY536_26685, partial [Enterobacter hormaechei]|nr:hypothetical protein [Enterobacter hormaechei]
FSNHQEIFADASKAFRRHFKFRSISLMRTWTDLYFHIAQLFAFRATTLVVKATDMSIGVQFPLAADISPIHERFMLASVTFDFENLPFSEVAKAHCGPPFKTSETP